WLWRAARLARAVAMRTTDDSGGRCGRLVPVVWHQSCEVEGLAAALPLRPAEEIALTGQDADAADRCQLLGCLDPFGHDRGLPPSGQFLERTQDCERWVVENATLDKRQVDLDDVELDLTEKPKARVPGADVVGRQPESGLPARRGIAAKPIEILDFLAFRELDHDLRGLDPAASEDRRDVAGVELLGLEGPGRQVHAEIDTLIELAGTLCHHLQAGEIDLDGSIGAFGGREQAVGVG